jgi:hypothetical protein
MSDIGLTIIPDQAASTPEKVNLAGKAVAPQKEIKIDRVELSKSIQSFDKKPRTRSFDYNSISLGKKKSELPTPTVSQMMSDPTYNMVGKFLGVGTHEWGQDYDKVHKVVEWAKTKSGAKSTEDIVRWISGALQVVPSLGMNHRKIDQLYLYSRLQQSK